MNTKLYQHGRELDLDNKNSFLQLNRFRLMAVLIHLAVSALIVSLICFVALFIWFPYPLFLLDGTWQALFILACVDVTLGPFITLIISSNKKSIKELLFDFSVVFCIQLAALSFGLLKVYDQRVVAMVHVESEFHIVPAIAVPKREEKSNRLPAFGRIHYGMLLNEDLSGMLRQEIELTMYNPQKYRTPELEVIEKALVPIEFIPDSVLTKYGNEVLYKLVIGKKRHGIAVMGKNMKIIDIVLARKKAKEGG